MIKNQKTFLFLGIILVTVFFGSLIIYYKSYKSKENKISPKTSSTPPITTPQPMITLTEEQKEIIANINTHTVKIENGKLNPETIVVKVHDQVSWVNNDKETYQIKGEDWGNVPINPGENFTQAFDKPGTFFYSCTLHPQLKGTVIVKE